MPAKAAAVLYAKDIGRVSTFYVRVAALEMTDAAADHVVLESAVFQLIIVAIPEAIGAHIDIASPPVRREETPLKLVFSIPAMQAARAAAPQFGGELNAVECEWHWQGAVVCDGHDPEGNVVQFREDAR